MRFLLDAKADVCQQSALIVGQLMTSEGGHALGPCPFAIDNGAFARFEPDKFRRLLCRCEPARERCLFVATPDVVGSARRTLEMFDIWNPKLEYWPRALVAQDGIEDLPIPWDQIAAVFIGGSTAWKESSAAADVVRAARIAELHVHVGRVNTIKRFTWFDDLGADTCDGTGVLMRGSRRFHEMLSAIQCGHRDDHPRLFDKKIINGCRDDQPDLVFGQKMGECQAGVSETSVGDALAAAGSE